MIRLAAIPYRALSVCLAVMLALSPARAGEEVRIAAVVNDGAISQADLSDRIRLAEVAGNIPDSQETRDRLKPIVLKALVDEQLQLQEAARLKLDVPDPEIDASFAKIAQQNKMSADAFEQALGKQGIPVSAMRAQIKAQLAWIKVVQKVVRPRIDIASEEIDSELAQLKSNAGKPEYLGAEILLTVDTPDQDAAVKAEADRLVTQLRQGGNFALAARQFSQSAGAATGGDLGWVEQGQLPQNLEDALSKLRPGQISDPVQDVSGYHILLLRERGTVAGPEADKVKVHLVQIVMPAKNKDPEVAAKAQQITQDTKGCDAAKTLAQGMNDNVSGDLGEIKLSQLPPQILTAVSDQPVGTFAPPLPTPKGFLLLMVCGRDQPETALPSRDEIANQIGFRRLDQQQRRYLRDLRASAYVDIRS